jgi:hypothetical protein
MEIEMKTLSLCVLSLIAVSCSKSTPTPDKEKLVAESPAPVAPSASAASAEREAPKKTIPTLVPGPFAGTKGMDVSLHRIEGAVMVAERLRVGRIVDERVEWVGSIPDEGQVFGGSVIIAVHGSWPDAVDAESMTMGRGPLPTIYPVTGKGVTRGFGTGGEPAWIVGTTRLGKTTLVGAYDFWTGYQFQTVRGPTLPIKLITAAKTGCNAEESKPEYGHSDQPAVPFRAVAATEAGTLVTLGNFCGRDKTPAAEVWEQPGKSRIIELGSLVKDIGYFPKMLKGKGDELWVRTNPVLHYNDGKFETLPAPDKPLTNLFVSPRGKLYGISGRTIVRYDDGKWTPIANLPRPMKFTTIVMDDEETIWVAYNGIARLRKASGADAESDCKTPFVYLYDVSWKNDAKFTFPTTRKALSTFPAVGEISLVEYVDNGRRLGVTVKSKEQGEAVIAHVEATMKDEHPEFICYAPKNPRVTVMKSGK